MGMPLQYHGLATGGTTKKVAHEEITTYISAAREYHPIRVAASRWHLVTNVHTTRDIIVYSILFSLSAKLIRGICCALPSACTPSNQNEKYAAIGVRARAVVPAFGIGLQGFAVRARIWLIASERPSRCCCCGRLAEG